ncbi:hypothetical protein MTR67_048128 [Solanum verrucosum]|uniref:Uncharacterized protein n=1 Tax=Solanum verrucosum TaxID=315347 RepID=A0AAF0UXE3_SOLVR|nr:hypothetical protein MTR67_048128 [Solanum verrucosum]
MMRLGIKPTIVSFINVFPAVSKIGDARVVDVLYGLLAKLGNAYVNDLFVVSAAIVMYAEQAEDVVTTDDVTFVSALMTTSQLQHWEFSQQLHACVIKKCRDSQFINDQVPLKFESNQEYPFYLFGGKGGVPGSKRRVLSKMTTSIKLSD